MNRKLLYMASGLLLVAGLSAAAQNLDPTVTVTRAYKGSVGDNEKPVPDMFVPDSVTQFKIKFDYRINPRTYKGSYEFNPYLLDLKPNPVADPASRIYLKVGAGYSLRPVFRAVWSPEFKKQNRFKMNVYASHDSYVGKYHDIGYVFDAGARKYGKIHDTGADMYSGYDLLTKVGADGRLDFEDSYFAFDANYSGIHTKTDSLAKGYNAARFYLKFASKERELYSLLWDAELRYNYGHHDLSHLVQGENAFNEHDLVFKTWLGAAVEQRMGVFVDADLNFVYYGGEIRPGEGASGMYAGNIAFTPRYTFNDDVWDISAGVRLDIPLSPKSGYINSGRGQIAYPDVRVTYTAVPKYLGIYLNALGGMNLNPYSELLETNHFISYKSRIGENILIDNTVERVNLSLGFRGQVAYRFIYDFSAGYALYASAPLDAFGVYGAAFDADGIMTSYADFTRGIMNQPYQMYYVALKWGVRTEPVEVDGYFRWQGTDLHKRQVQAFEPSRFIAGARAEYNWRRRVFAGVVLEGALARRGYLTGAGQPVETSIPGYVNLCVDARYRINPRISVWLEGSNLCNQLIQRTAFYAERGIDVRAGVTLNF